MRGIYEDSETMVMSAVGIIHKFTVGGIIPGKCSELLLVCKVLVDWLSQARDSVYYNVDSDIVIYSGSREQVEINLEKWRYVLETRH